MFHTEKLLRVENNKLNLAIRKYLMIEYKGRQFLVSIFIRKLTLVEQNCDICYEILLGIVAILESKRVYAERSPRLIIYTGSIHLVNFIIITLISRK